MIDSDVEERQGAHHALPVSICARCSLPEKSTYPTLVSE